MSFTIDLPPDTIKRIEIEAKKRELPVESYLIRIIEEAVNPSKPTNGRELVAYWRSLGVVGDWADREDIQDSSQFACELREQAQNSRHG